MEEKGVKLEKLTGIVMERAKNSDFSMKIRLYYAVSRYMKHEHKKFDGCYYDCLENLCFSTIQKAIYENGKEKIPEFGNYRIVKDEVAVELPVRVTGAEAGRIRRLIVMKMAELF